MSSAPKRICLISVEIFAWGKYGGYGKSTRIIGRELVRRGYEVSAVVPRRQDQQPEEWLDGIKVYGLTPMEMLTSSAIYKKINADIFHSCEPSIGTWLAMKAVPDAVHLVTCQDPKGYKEWVQEFSFPSKSRVQVLENYLFEANILVRSAVRAAHGVFVPAKYQRAKAKSIYNLKADVEFLPTPAEMPGTIVKSESPVVLYMGRLDQRKRPELTLRLAKDFPEVLFKIAGKSRTPPFEMQLKEQFGHNPNVEFLGFVDQFKSEVHHQLFSQAWIHINTSVREGLPNSFIEAAGHQCAILSYVNPDDFASRFGYHAAANEFHKGLEYLLSGNKWRELGKDGYTYVEGNYSLPYAMDAHEEIYQKIFRQKRTAH
ncbi:MAG: glycosyltransferase family 4 protein [Saprospiraceae bacterium]|nr:glycosyltransferase family 4 protein [Saprospiraceae bacterium]